MCKIGFYYLRKYKVFTQTQTCELNIELTVSKNCDPLIASLWVLIGPQCGKSW